MHRRKSKISTYKLTNASIYANTIKPLLNDNHTAFVSESIEEHKYSRFSMSSYYKENPEEVKYLFNVMQETRGFQIDRSLSSNEHSIFHNPRTNETIVLFRGTASKKDLGTDLKVLFSKELDSQRIKVSENVIEK